MPAPRDASAFAGVVRHGEPVIFTNQYAGQPLAKVTPRSSEDILRDVPLRAIRVTENFVRRPEIRGCTFAEYRRWIASDPSCDLWCYQPLPASLARLMRRPAYLDRTHAVTEWLYVSNARPPLSLHFDVDFRQNLMTQVFGEKRFILVAPRYSKRLSPYFNYSLMALTNYSEAEKSAFVAHNRAYDCLLRAGESIFIPKSWWHYVEYLDFSMSVSLRFARAGFDAPLAKLPISYLLQNLGNAIVDEADGVVRHVGAFKALMDAFYRPAPRVIDRYRRFYDVKERLYAELCPEALQGNYLSKDFDLERRKIARGRSLWSRLRTPLSYSGADPEAALTRQDVRRLAEHLGARLTRGTMPRGRTFLGERKRLDEFTQLEAAQAIDQGGPLVR